MYYQLLLYVIHFIGCKVWYVSILYIYDGLKLLFSITWLTNKTLNDLYQYFNYLITQHVQCKSPYAAKWKHNRKRCPNLVPSKNDIKSLNDKNLLKNNNNSYPVTVYFDKDDVYTWDSLIHLYNDYYLQYYNNATYPRLIIRFEDMLINAPKILQIISNCLNGNTSTSTKDSSSSNIVTVNTNFQYLTGKAKTHGSGTTFIKAIIKTGNITDRINSLTNDDIQFVTKYLNNEFFIKTMHYTIP